MSPDVSGLGGRGRPPVGFAGGERSPPIPRLAGDLHLGDWPENLAGPEYWLYKKLQGED